MAGNAKVYNLFSAFSPSYLFLSVCPPLRTIFYSSAKNCSYFKHFTSGEEAEVFEVKTQKGGWIFANSDNKLPQHHTLYVSKSAETSNNMREKKSRQ